MPTIASAITIFAILLPRMACPFQNRAAGAQYRSVIKKRRKANHPRRAVEYDAIL
jgi:hypothetical protein